jgi:hypothetical protein
MDEPRKYQRRLAFAQRKKPPSEPGGFVLSFSDQADAVGLAASAARDISAVAGISSSHRRTRCSLSSSISRYVETTSRTGSKSGANASRKARATDLAGDSACGMSRSSYFPREFPDKVCWLARATWNNGPANELARSKLAASSIAMRNSLI